MFSAFFGFFGLACLAFALFVVAALWKIFTKAGQPGWAAIVPIYNVVVKLRIVGRPVWWILLLLIPLVNLVIWFIMSVDLAKSFGKDVAYGVGLFFLPFIFHPMLGFGSATYVGPAVKSA